MKFYFKYILVFLVGCTTLFSCVEDQDFGLYDEIRITPKAEASILYIEAPESSINASEDVDVISRNFNFDAFSSDNFAKRLLDGTVTYIVENTTSKDMSIKIEFLNVEDKVIDRVIIDSPRNMSSQLDIAYGTATRSINIIKQTLSIRVTFSKPSDDTTSTSDQPDPKIILKSSGKFRLNIK